MAGEREYVVVKFAQNVANAVRFSAALVGVFRY